MEVGTQGVAANGQNLHCGKAKHVPHSTTSSQSMKIMRFYSQNLN